MDQGITRRTALVAVGAAVGSAALANAAKGEDAQQAAAKDGKLRLFQKVDPERIQKGAPPIVFHPAPDGHIVFKNQQELKDWEDEVRTRLGATLHGEVGTASESCSAGCSDDCD